MKKTDVLIIGGSASGIVTAITGKSNYPDKSFTVVRIEDDVMVPCGIPYIFGTLMDANKNKIPDEALTNMGIDLVIDEAISIDREARTCSTRKGESFEYEKLVLATGSKPANVSWLKNADLNNVFTVTKDKPTLEKILETIPDTTNVVVIGGGFIGVEFADELNKRDKKVTVVELLPRLLAQAFDEEMSAKARSLLEERGVNVICGKSVKELQGQNKVEGVVLSDGENLPADMVILAVGYQPNVGLAKEAGLEINEVGSIRVDEYMRTCDPNILAVGDCAEKRQFTTRNLHPVMLASTATSEARIAGMNLFKLCAVKTFIGTISIFSTGIGDTGFAVAGLTKSKAEEEGFEVVEGSFEGPDKHPGSLPGTHPQSVRLVVSKDSGVILGGEIMGGGSTGELINFLGLAIQNRMTVNSLQVSQIGTHPLLTSPPTAYPVIKAAEIAMRNCNSG